MPYHIFSIGYSASRKHPTLSNQDIKENDMSMLFFNSGDPRANDTRQQLPEEYSVIYPKRVTYIAEGQAPVMKLQAEMLAEDPLYSLARKKL